MSRPIWLLSLAAFMAAATTRACDALLPNIAATFAAPVSTAAVAITAFTFAYGSFQLAYGPVGARLGAYRTVVLATALAASGAFVCAAAPSLGWLAAGRFWSGLTAAAIIPMSMAHIGETVAYEERQAVIARFLIGQVLGLVFGQAFAGLFAELLTWRELFVLLGLGFLAVAAALAVELRSGRVGGRGGAAAGARGAAVVANPLAQYLAVLRVPWARVVLATVFLEGFLCFGAFPYVAAHLKLGFDLSYLAIGLVMSAFGLGGLIYVLGVRRLLRWLGEPGLAGWGGALLLLGFLLAALAPAWPIVVPAAVAIGGGFYMLHNTLQTNATQMAPFDRSAAIALFAFALFVGQSLGATLMGHVAAATGYPAIFASAGVGLVVLALAFRRAKLGQM